MRVTSLFVARDQSLMGSGLQAVLDTIRARARLPVSFIVRDPAGAATMIGEGAIAFEIRIMNDAGMSALRSFSELEIAEAYIRGDIDVEGDLIEAMRLRQVLTDRKPWIRIWARLQPMLLGRKRLNPRWIAKHYDANNVQLFGAEERYNTYTPGIYEHGDSYEDAAARKLDYAFRSLRLCAGASLLDVGCGWGGFLRYAAARGVRVTGITLSRHQLEYAQRRLAEDSLEAEVLYRDFFAFTPGGRFDAISMMGVLEDLADYRRVAKRIGELLRPGGRVYSDFASSDRRTGNASFITKHVWPGTFRMVYLPELFPALVEAGLDVVEMHNDRQNYYLWAKIGHDRWVERKAAVVAASDERTWRMMHVLYAGAAHVMATSPGGTTAYRLVAELRGGERHDAVRPVTDRDSASAPSADPS
jgi:cyclopropane-fatty-acyl-phospholipid synthase